MEEEEEEEWEEEEEEEEEQEEEEEEEWHNEPQQQSLSLQSLTSSALSFARRVWSTHQEPGKGSTVAWQPPDDVGFFNGCGNDAGV